MLGFDFVAYIDPGAGSLLVQLMVGGVAGVAVILKLQWRRLRSIFIRGPSSET